MNEVIEVERHVKVNGREYTTRYRYEGDQSLLAIFKQLLVDSGIKFTDHQESTGGQ